MDDINTILKNVDKMQEQGKISESIKILKCKDILVKKTILEEQKRLHEQYLIYKNNIKNIENNNVSTEELNDLSINFDYYYYKLEELEEMNFLRSIYLGMEERIDHEKLKEKISDMLGKKH